MEELGIHLSKDDVTAMVHVADKNADGKIDYKGKKGESLNWVGGKGKWKN